MDSRDLPRLADEASAFAALLNGQCARRAAGKHDCTSVERDLKLLQEWDARGYPAPGQPGPRGKGDHSDPTVAAYLKGDSAISYTDPITGLPQDGEWWLRRAFESMHAYRVIHELVNHREKNTGRSSSGADCAACGRFVPGTPDDRIRNGYCDACRKAWERTADPVTGERQDRALFERKRREEAA